jgi:hypothetical protein
MSLKRNVYVVSTRIESMTQIDRNEERLQELYLDDGSVVVNLDIISWFSLRATITYTL